MRVLPGSIPIEVLFQVRFCRAAHCVCFAKGSIQESMNARLGCRRGVDEFKSLGCFLSKNRIFRCT